MSFFKFFFLFFLTSCTYNVSFVQTEGTAEDVIDDTTTPKSDVSVPVNIPKM